MMKQIDFLPQRYREQHTLRKARWWQCGVLLLFGICVVSATVGQYTIRRRLQRELDSVVTRRADAATKLAQVTHLRGLLNTARAEAELLAHLQRPWPRTQLLADIVGELPASMALTELTIADEKLQPAAFVPRQSDNTSAQDNQTAAHRDLLQLRKEQEVSRTVIRFSGTCLDSSELHRYLAALQQGSLFEEAKLEAMEVLSVRDSGKRGRSSFTVRVLVRRPWDQTDQGPGPAHVSSLPAGSNGRGQL